MKIAIFVAAYCVAVIAHAGDWAERDTALLGGALGLLLIDWGQTRDLATRTETRYLTPVCADPDTRKFAELCATTAVRRYQESNPLLSKEPTLGQVDRYFGLVMLGTAGLAYALPPAYRRPFLGTVIVLESLVVLHNHSMGLRFSF